MGVKRKKDADPPRSRAFIFTLNNYTPEETDDIRKLVYKYLVFGREVGEQGTPHLQGYIYFKNAKTLSAAIKTFPRRAHLEIAIDTATGNYGYCTKDGDFEEFGVRPLTDQEKGAEEKARYQNAWDLAKAGNIEDIDPDIRVRLYGTLKKIRADYLPIPEAQDKMDFHWYVGPAGCGKTWMARTKNKVHYLKDPNTKWWCGYVDQPCVIIEDYDKKCDPMLQQMLKRWADRWPFNAETKGGHFNVRPSKIIITSNYTMRDVFGHDEPGLLLPLLRRFRQLDFLELDTRWLKLVSSLPIYWRHDTVE